MTRTLSIKAKKNLIRNSRGILKGVSTQDLIKLRRQERLLEQQKYKRYGIATSKHG